jgi:hypothetical protein
LELGARRRGGSRGVWARRRGWEAMLGRGGVIGRVGVGGAGLWWRVDGRVSSPEFKQGGGGILKWGSTEKAKGREELFAGIEVVLVRARDEALGCCSGLSTAAARDEALARSQRRWRSRATRGRQREARGDGLALHGARGRHCTAHGGETEQRGWRKGKRAVLKFLKFPGT